MTVYQGISAAGGYAYAPAFVLKQKKLVSTRISIKKEELPQQIQKLEKALADTVKEIQSLQKNAFDSGSQEQVEVFEAYLEIVQDEELSADVIARMKEKLVDVETALSDVCAEYAADMAALDDPYMQARADDFRQIFRIISESCLGEKADYSEISGDFVLVALEAGPADMGRLDKKHLKAVVVKTGSRTSHAAIVCRAAGIPMVSGLPDDLLDIPGGTMLAVDGNTGKVAVTPDEQTKADCLQHIQDAELEKKELASYLNKEARTGGGTRVELMANIGTLEELDTVNAANADGIGLFRTEFLFMESASLPDEQTQFNVYKQVLTRLGNRPVVFRTLDAGGDKQIAALGIPQEENPFLGWRAVRYCLKTPQVFRTQLRALLKASIYGNCKIMVPMITSEHEVVQAKTLLESVRQELLEEEGIKTPVVPFGIMIETPAAALVAHDLAKHVDFFSLGTNDLTQYTLAVDRGNEYVSELYDEMHPAVLYLIKYVVQVAQKENIAVHMCGEMAGDTRCAQILLDYGLREFSMSPSRILPYKKHLCSLS